MTSSALMYSTHKLIQYTKEGCFHGPHNAIENDRARTLFCLLFGTLDPPKSRCYLKACQACYYFSEMQ